MGEKMMQGGFCDLEEIRHFRVVVLFVSTKGI